MLTKYASIHDATYTLHSGSTVWEVWEKKRESQWGINIDPHQALTIIGG